MLTKHQEEKLKVSLNIQSKNDRLLISGSAGVGKTFMVNELIYNLKNCIFLSAQNKIILCTAPTNKALSVLKGKVDEMNNLDFNTVHSALKLKRNISKDGKVFFNPNFKLSDPPLKGVGIMIIDECSMINSDILGNIEEHASNNGTKVIFIGDKKQINPVMEDESIVFYAKYPEVELTEIIRQGEGSPIIDLSRNLNLLSGTESVITPDGKGYTHSRDMPYILQELAKVNGTDELKYLAWTNKEVDLVNSTVRKMIYGSPRKLEVDETIVFNNPYNNVYYTNQEVMIKTLEVKTLSFNNIMNGNSSIFNNVKDDKLYYKVYVANAKREQSDFKGDGKYTKETIIVIHEDSEKKLTIYLNKLKAACKNRMLDWVDFFKFKERFADFKYNHALSVHKSQGSTYKKCVINVSNIAFNKNKKERVRLLYTAVTRASDLVVIYKP